MTRSHGGPLVLLTCLIAHLSYLGAITPSALITFLLPTSLLVGTVGLRMRRSLFPATALVLVTGFAGAALVNLASGEFSGPAAKSTAIAATCTGLAVVLSATQMPATFLIPMTGVIIGSLSLGAGGQVQLVSVITAAAALVALASVERENRAMTTPERNRGGLLAMLALVSLVGIFAAVFQGQFSGRPAEAPLRTTVNKEVQPPGLLAFSTPGNDARERARTSDLPVVGEDLPLPTELDPAGQPVMKDSSLVDDEDGASRLWWLLIALPLGLLLLLAARLAFASWTWRRHYRQILRSGRDAGAAWLWALAHLHRVRLAPPGHLSPDVIAAGDVEDLDGPLRDQVQDLAALVAPAVFAARSPTDLAHLEETWAQARRTASGGWQSAGLGSRCLAHWRLAPRRPHSRPDRVGGR